MIRIEHIEKTYDRHSSHANHVLKDISLTLPDTGFVCILGPSGCGKTTLMNVIGGLDTYDSGTISTDAVSVKRYGTAEMERERNNKFGYIFQNYYLLSERTVAYNVFLGLHSLSEGRLEKLRRVKAALRAVGMERYARKKAGELSGGQQQRVAIARALARKPQVIFADEPTGNLDATNTAQVCGMLKAISAECLVVMVTHEENVAKAYADRIIRLEDGRIVADTVGETVIDGVAKNDDAAKINDTAKSDDAAKGEALIESGTGGNVPTGETAEPEICVNRRAAKRKDGERRNAKVFQPKDYFWEVRSLITAKGKRTKSLIACLAVVAALLIVAVGDYLTLATVQTRDFIMNDSHLVEVKVERGGYHQIALDEPFAMFLDYLDEAIAETGVDATYLPTISDQILYTNSIFVQMDAMEELMSGFSCIPIEFLSPDTLIHGRMPETRDEIVVDIWTLERFLSKGGVLQASVGSPIQFLNEVFNSRMKGLELTVVGICDSGEPSVYMDKFAIFTIASSGSRIMSLETLQEMFPGKYDDIVLADNECLAGPDAKLAKVGQYFGIAKQNYRAVGIVKEDIVARLIVNEDQEDEITRALMETTRNFLIYTSDKETVKKLINDLPEELFGIITVTAIDYHTQYMEAYEAAAREKVGARAIVTAAILVISAIMLILMLKARVDGRVEMLSVYRLLGIPHRQILSLFALESLWLSVCSALPAALAVWAVIKGMTVMPSIEFSMELPFATAAAAYVALLLFHLLFSLFPVVKLLRLPPAVLAGKYDF